MSTPPAPARLHVLFAREAPVGVIFRRGPSRQVRLILWRTDTDTFVPGQWLKGKIDSERAALSPDGHLLAYPATDYRSRRFGELRVENVGCLGALWLVARAVAAASDPHYVGPSWVAISRPPYLTALALWSADRWGQPDLAFPEKRTLLLPGGRAPVPDRPLPLWLRVQAAAPLWNRWRARGWHPTARSGVREKPLAGGRYFVQSDGRSYALHDSLTGRSAAIDAEQAEVDPSGRLVLARSGKLLAAIVAPDRTLIEMELADFHAMTFEPIAPPEWARRWPPV